VGIKLFRVSDSKLPSKSMGGFSSSKLDTSCRNTRGQKGIQLNLPNPDPDNYKIIRTHKRGNLLILKIKYLDCTNYEGEKILVFANTSLDKLLKQKRIDPHFCDSDKFISPIARFIPDEEGWNMAEKFAEMYNY